MNSVLVPVPGNGLSRARVGIPRRLQGCWLRLRSRRERPLRRDFRSCARVLSTTRDRRRPVLFEQCQHLSEVTGHDSKGRSTDAVPGQVAGRDD